ncbi:MAG: hypothetical protein ACK47B_22675 [Armatimonadota bacterium]
MSKHRSNPQQPNEDRRRKLVKQILAPAVWERWVDILEKDHDLKVQRIEERLDEAVRITGEDRETAIGTWFSFGAGHDPEKMKQGLSGRGRLFKVFSQRVFDTFSELGGEN